MERNDLESYLKQLENIDKQLSDDSDIEPSDFIKELNDVLNALSTDLQLDAAKKTTIAKLKFVNKSNNPDPTFAHEGDSGFDLRANLSKDQLIDSGKVVLIPTGLYFEVDKGLEIQIRSRSGIALKNHMFVLNTPGTIDSHYRGEVQIILANLDETSHTIRNGDRIAQGVVCPVYGEGNLTFEKVEKLSETVRNSQGFGSTGKT
jgi:dUTP pyrophosphatase